MKLGTIEEELELCRVAFTDSKVGDMAWCVHHRILCEPLSEPARSRIRYILTEKPEYERARRLHEMRPVKGEVPAELAAAYAAAAAAYAAYAAAAAYADAAYAAAAAAACKQYKPALETLHAAECPDSTWDGTTIFPE